ncbi:hypothetical protein [Streptomyces sp. COG19]|uniref:hypothetical protein n=1 Tax=Streptomyces sp. COG19 TaxID=2838870 RepID=UPI0035B2BDB2
MDRRRETSPLLRPDLPLTERGRLRCTATLAVEGMPTAWAAGDAAAVPDLTAAEPGKETAPNAQHAVRQAKVLADNVLATLDGSPLTGVPPLVRGIRRLPGLHKGVAHVYGRKLKGYPPG